MTDRELTFSDLTFAIPELDYAKLNTVASAVLGIQVPMTQTTLITRDEFLLLATAAKLSASTRLDVVILVRAFEVALEFFRHCVNNVDKPVIQTFGIVDEKHVVLYSDIGDDWRNVVIDMYKQARIQAFEKTPVCSVLVDLNNLWELVTEPIGNPQDASN